MERTGDATREEVRSLPLWPQGVTKSRRIHSAAPPPPADQSECGQGAGLDSIPEDKPLTAREAAKILGMSYNLFNKKVRAGKIG